MGPDTLAYLRHRLEAPLLGFPIWLEDVCADRLRQLACIDIWIHCSVSGLKLLAELMSLETHHIWIYTFQVPLASFVAQVVLAADSNLVDSARI